ncbi:hypothetical protein OAT84_02505 [Gammaproteobacteria bacterium]|nr:hypothetical protein [Gammaproteobacteria bacterium]
MLGSVLSDSTLEQLNNIEKSYTLCQHTQEMLQYFQALDQLLQAKNLPEELKIYYMSLYDVYLDHAYKLMLPITQDIVSYIEYTKSYSRFEKYRVEMVVWHPLVPKSYQYQQVFFFTDLFFGAWLWFEIGHSTLDLEFQITKLRLEESCVMNAISRYHDFYMKYKKYVEWLESIYARSYMWHWVLRRVVMKIKQSIQQQFKQISQKCNTSIKQDEYSAAILMRTKSPQLLSWRTEIQWQTFLGKQQSPYWHQAYQVMQSRQVETISWDEGLVQYWLEKIQGNPYQLFLLLEHSAAGQQLQYALFKTLQYKNPLDLYMLEKIYGYQFHEFQKGNVLDQVHQMKPVLPWWHYATDAISNFIRSYALCTHEAIADMALTALNDLVVMLRLGWKSDVVTKVALVWKSIKLVFSCQIDRDLIIDINQHLDQLAGSREEIEGVEGFLQALILHRWPKQHAYTDLRAMLESCDIYSDFWSTIQIKFIEEENNHAKLQIPEAFRF